MKLYTIIAEPRVGGLTLSKWISDSEGNFDFAHEPWGLKNTEHTNSTNVEDISWIVNRRDGRNLLIKELWAEEKNFSPLIEISDKVLCLYRENWYDQVRSLLHGIKTEKWHRPYTMEEIEKVVSEEEIIETYNSWFKDRKESFTRWIQDKGLLPMSYEDVYTRGSLDKVISHFEMKSPKAFPINQRYLVDKIKLI